MSSLQDDDIISALQKRQMQRYIAEDILELLEVDSLSNAEKVSRFWKQAIVEGRLWKKLFERLVTLHQNWRSMCVILQSKLTDISDSEPVGNQHEMYRKNCLLIEESIQTLKRNWSAGDCIVEEFLCNDRFSSLASIEFQMDDKHIVRCRRPEGVFEVFNRWTLKLENTIPKDDDLANISCFHFNGNLLITGSASDGRLCVRHLQTGEQLHIFKDYLSWPLMANDPHDRPSIFHTAKVCLSPTGQHLLSIMSGKQRAVDHDRFLLTLRRFVTAQEVSVTHQLLMEENVDYLDHLYVDDRYVVLETGFKPGTTEYADGLIEIRSTDTFLTVDSIPRPEGSFGLHYSDGLLILGTTNYDSQTRDIKIRDLKTATWVGRVHFPDNSRIVHFRLIGDQYIVGHSREEALVKVWNLQSAIKANPLDSKASESDSLLLCSMESRRRCGCALVLADQYQVYMFATFYPSERSGVSFVTVFDFLKGINDEKKPLHELYH